MKKNNVIFAHPVFRFLAVLTENVFGFLLFGLAVWWVSGSQTYVSVVPRMIEAAVWYFVVWGFAQVFLQVFLISKLGAGLGGIFFGLKIVDEEGNNLTFKRAFFRQTVGMFFGASVYWLGFFWSFVDKSHQGWQDQVSDTVVTLRNTFGPVLGLLALVFLIASNVAVFGMAAKSFETNAEVYQQFSKEVQKLGEESQKAQSGTKPKLDGLVDLESQEQKFPVIPVQNGMGKSNLDWANCAKNPKSKFEYPEVAGDPIVCIDSSGKRVEWKR